MYHFYSLLACISLIRLCHGQFNFSQTIEGQKAFDLSVDISTALVTLVQEFLITGNNRSDEVSLYNVSINFENGECVNPSVTIEHEAIDNDGDNEALYVFYGSFNNDSQIAQCTHADSEGCDAYVLCVDFQPPPGIYTNLLPFFISTGDDVDAFCGDSADEEGPLRTWRARFTVFCGIEIPSPCSSAEEVEDEGEDQGEVAEDASSSSEDRQNAVQEFGNRLEEDHDLMNDYHYNDIDNDYDGKPEVVTFQFAEETSSNLWIMFVVSVSFCCIAECGVIYILYNRK